MLHAYLLTMSPKKSSINRTRNFWDHMSQVFLSDGFPVQLMPVTYENSINM